MVAKVRKKAGKKAARKAKRDRKPPRRRRRPDERAALLSDLARRLTKLGKARIDEIQEMYDAAYAQARVQAKRARTRSGDSGASVANLRQRLDVATETLKTAFALDAIDESQAIADLQFTIAVELGRVTDENDILPAQLAINGALAAWSQETRTRERKRTLRLWDWLRARGLAASIPRSAVRAMLADAERAVAVVRADEKRFRSEVDTQRSFAAEWSSKARLARSIGEDDLAAQADARVAEHERLVGELESELTNQTAVLVKLEGQLAELCRSVG